MLLTLIALGVSYAQQTQIRFERLDDRDGLSHNRVTSILEDDLGFIWFGTLSGLNRFDGSEIKVLKYDENDPYSLHNANIAWIKEGPHKRIWIKTSYGVIAYDIYKQKFVDITDVLNKLQIDNYNLAGMEESEGNIFWFLVDGVGVAKYNANTDSMNFVLGVESQITSIAIDNNKNLSVVDVLGQVTVYDTKTFDLLFTFDYPPVAERDGLQAVIDKDGGYWFYSNQHPFGVWFQNPVTGYTKFFGEKEIGSHLVTDILQDQNGQIIIGVDHVGLWIISKSDWSMSRHSNNPSDSKSLSHNTIVSLYQDKSDVIWIGTNKAGINYYYSKSGAFKFHKQMGNVSGEGNDMIQITEADNNNLWIGTDGGGLLYFDRKNNKFERFMRNSADQSSISSDIIITMANDKKGGLWIGTYLGGLNHFDGKTFRKFTNDKDDPNSLSDNSVWKVFVDSKDNLWLGTLKGGVDVYDASFNKILELNQGNSSIHSDYITSFQEDSEGRIWIGTGFGVEIYDPLTESFQHLLRDDTNAQTISNNSINDLYFDSSENMWLGTMYGLNKISIATGEIDAFTKKEGLPHNFITSIVEDDDGTMWFGTYNGLSRMNMTEGEPKFENFDVSDGLQGNMFNERAVAKLSNGELVFGGKNGINVINPRDVKSDKPVDNLVFLDFHISNRKIQPDEHYNGRKWFENGINSTKSLSLRHYENSFSFGFASLNYYQPENTIYKYRLVGFDTTWVVHPNVRTANYTNLDPGNYRFEVMASNQIGKWNSEPIGMDITISSPLWRTPMAYVTYAFILLVLFYFTWRLIIQKERFRAQMERERLEANRMHDLDLMKIRFFTNISHEFRTPLTLIITPIERLMKLMNGSKEVKEFQLIHRNAKRLLTLVNQLLDFRKMEANQHQLSLASGDLISFINEIAESFSDLTNERNIKMEINANKESFLTLFDRDKVEKIFFNLFSNAIKFTPSHGNVTVSIDVEDSFEEITDVKINVSDSGIGIPKENQQDIFKRFFQMENNDSLHLNHGSGIGLSITKEFVEMHGGSIKVESTPGKGSNFLLWLPMKQLGLSEAMLETGSTLDELKENQSPELPTVLIVEDNTDFRFYLMDNLKQYFNIQGAHDGKEAWRKMMKSVPDVIISDIMMPGMSGIELCKKVKGDPRTAHLPVILLSARHSDEQKLEGYEAGATEYLTKPFNFEILLRSIKSSIQLQKFIHAAENRVQAEPSEIEIVSLDEKFIKNALKIVEDNMSNADFSVQELSRELGVSRGQLYKKILEITGKTPIEFIRAIRLKRAAVLLEKSQLTVAEVAYNVGFNNPKYFAKYFKAEYKVLPSKYAVGLHEA